MCTITFLPLRQKSKEFILTSNRDEAMDRKTLPPEVYTEDGVKLLFPKDAVAGGTWIGISEKQRLVCLMNGAFEKHVRKSSYGKSRGLVVKDLLKADDLVGSFNKYDLEQVEPFTCIVVEWKEELKLFRLVWDGKQRFPEELPLKKYIWASSFLYSSKLRKERKQDFQAFSNGREMTAEVIMNFHSSEGAEGEKGLVIDQGILKTCSITQVVRSSEVVEMAYTDLLQHEKPTYVKRLNI